MHGTSLLWQGTWGPVVPQPVRRRRRQAAPPRRRLPVAARAPVADRQRRHRGAPARAGRPRPVDVLVLRRGLAQRQPVEHRDRLVGRHRHPGFCRWWRHARVGRHRPRGPGPRVRLPAKRHLDDGRARSGPMLSTSASPMSREGRCHANGRSNAAAATSSGTSGSRSSAVSCRRRRSGGAGRVAAPPGRASCARGASRARGPSWTCRWHAAHGGRSHTAPPHAPRTLLALGFRKSSGNDRSSRTATDA